LRRYIKAHEAAAARRAERDWRSKAGAYTHPLFSST
jgi:hypothetical protein